MDLLKTFSEFSSKDQAVEKAAFEAAMIEKLKIEPYKMSDLLFEIYSCRREVEGFGMAMQHLWIELEGLEDMIEDLQDQLIAKKKAKKA